MSVPPPHVLREVTLQTFYLLPFTFYFLLSTFYLLLPLLGYNEK